MKKKLVYRSGKLFNASKTFTHNDDVSSSTIDNAGRNVISRSTINYEIDLMFKIFIDFFRIGCVFLNDVIVFDRRCNERISQLCDNGARNLVVGNANAYGLLIHIQNPRHLAARFENESVRTWQRFL